MSDRMPERMPNRTSKYMLDRMPNRTSEYMSDRMREIMPDRSLNICQIECHLVGVGITRRIFFGGSFSNKGKTFIYYTCCDMR